MDTLTIMLVVYYGVILIAMAIVMGVYIHTTTKELEKMKEDINQLKKERETEIEMTLEEALKIAELLEGLTKKQIKKDLKEMTAKEKILLRDILERAMELLNEAESE